MKISTIRSQPTHPQTSDCSCTYWNVTESTAALALPDELEEHSANAEAGKVRLTSSNVVVPQLKKQSNNQAEPAARTKCMGAHRTHPLVIAIGKAEYPLQVATVSMAEIES